VQRHGAFVDHCGSEQELNLVDFRGLGAFLALTDFERHAIALGKGFETVTLNFREVNKDVRTIILLDESEPFGVVKPFHCTFSHCLAPFRPPLGPVEIVVQTLLLVTTNKKTHNRRGLCVLFLTDTLSIVEQKRLHKLTGGLYMIAFTNAIIFF
jgi:hypothetical protein